MKNLYLLIIVALVIFTSCQSFYQAGYAGSDYHNLETPVNKSDTTIRNHYVGGGFQNGIEYYLNEKNDIQFLSYHYAFSKKYMGFAVGMNAFHGNYRVNSFYGNYAHLNKDYEYWGGQILADVNFNIPISSKVNWRVIGAQFSWNFERGEFYRIHEALGVEKSSAGDVFTDILNFAFYVDTEILFSPTDNLNISLYSATGSNVRRLGFDFISGASLEFYNVGLQGMWKSSTVDFAHSFMITDDLVNDFTRGWQFGVYYKF